MPTIHMTKSAVDALKAASKDTVYWDAGLPGFGVKVTPRSRKVFVVLYRIGGAGSRLLLNQRSTLATNSGSRTLRFQ